MSDAEFCSTVFDPARVAYAIRSDTCCATYEQEAAVRTQTAVCVDVVCIVVDIRAGDTDDTDDGDFSVNSNESLVVEIPVCMYDRRWYKRSSLHRFD